jgi:hypothetical protein
MLTGVVSDFVRGDAGQAVAVAGVDADSGVRTQAYVFSIWSYLVVRAARFLSVGPTAGSKLDTLTNRTRHHMELYLPMLVLVLRRPNKTKTP